MKSGLKIRWTEEATKNLDSIITYLEDNWTNKELTRFFTKLEKQISILSIFPEAFPISKKKSQVHRCVFMKQLTIYYAIESEHLVLLSIFDNRQNPGKKYE
ncbi:MAG: type II toxin-antitoxin system RelE/ParE family toxin [Bacteroidales bacterium]|nr:type II toxin-antitoxin system RelE/ParE family toxin [Bacteroidales bacterium]